MDSLGLTIYDRPSVSKAEESFKQTKLATLAIELDNKNIILGHQTEFLSYTTSCVLEAVKSLGHLKERVEKLIQPKLQAVQDLKKNVLCEDNQILDLKEILILLCSLKNENIEIQKAYDSLSKLKGCNAHSTHILSEDEEKTLKELNINLTCLDRFNITSLFD